jgi:CheY-like chemotaxis protein
MKAPLRFILIDDDEINNMVCSIVIKSQLGKLEIETFVDAELGLRYIQKAYTETNNALPSVLLLDINMPNWSGWEFLDNYAKLDQKIKSQIKIYMLSSSVDANDIKRAKSTANVVAYISKPLTIEAIAAIKGTKIVI